MLLLIGSLAGTWLISGVIPTMIYYETRLHLQKVFGKLGYNKGDFPETEKISEQIFSIPMHPYLTSQAQDKIIEELNNA